MDRIDYEVELRPDPSARPWSPAWLELEESLDAPYQLHALIQTADATIELEALAGVQCSISMRRGDDVRLVHGIVVRARYGGVHHGQLHVKITVAPAWALMAHTQRSRCFHDLTVPAIVQAVAGEHLAALDRRIVVDRLRRQYVPRDLCTQFRETDLAFVTRLLAEEGITLAWDQGEQQELAVLIDDSSDFVPLGESLAEGSDDAEPPDVRVLTHADDFGAVHGVHAAAWVHDVVPAGITTTAWDWRPTIPEQMDATAVCAPNRARVGTVEVRERRRLIERGDGIVDHTASLAARMHAEIDASTETRMQANVLTMAPGRTFALHGHPHPEFDRGYFVVHALHRFDPGSATQNSGAPELMSEVQCRPIAQRHQPPHQPRPEVPGFQTATVVGPDGEDIHTDRYGRVLVQLPWSSTAPTCWARVAQAWAGPQFGAMALPRIGMEVVVAFEDGDPDRPLVTGCVYNGANLPPASLPENRSVTTLRTRSTPDDDDKRVGYNELRFEDARGHEEVALHAERNLVQRVRSCHVATVGVDQTVDVGRKRYASIGEEDRVHVRGLLSHESLNRLVMVGGFPPEGAGAYGDSLHVHGEHRIYVDGNSETVVKGGDKKTEVRTYPEGLAVDAHEEIVFRIRHSSTSIRLTKHAIEIVADTITLCSPNGSKVSIGDAIGVASGTSVTLAKTFAMSTDAGPSDVVESTIVLGEDTVDISANAEVNVNCLAGGAVKLESDVDVSGSSLKLHTTKHETELRLEVAAATTTAPTIKSVAKGAMVLTGKPIKLN